MASIIRNIEYIKTHFDKHSDFVIKKIESDNISLSHKSTKYVSDIVYPIVNYIDFVNNGKYDGLELLSINNIIELYKDWVINNKLVYTSKNYIENNNILFDYRKSNIGLYWVDLNCYYSSEMVFRMNNCGRVNSYQNFLELREYDLDNFNYSRVVVVISKDGFINQIKGVYNFKPDIIYRDFIYDLFLNYKNIKGFKFLFSKETDFTHMDLTKEQLSYLKKNRPEFFNLC